MTSFFQKLYANRGASFRVDTCLEAPFRKEEVLFFLFWIGLFVRTLNASFLALTLKKREAEDIKVWGLYKFRLKEVTRQVISKTQNAFVEDRPIPDARTSDEAIDSTKKSL